MVHLFNLLGGVVRKAKLRRYKRAKNISERLNNNQPPDISVVDYLYYLWAKYVKCGFIRTKLQNNLNNRFLLWFATQYYAIWAEGTFVNYIAKSVIGFLGGVFLVYAVYTFLAIPMNFHIFSSTFTSIVFMLILPLGLAFSLIIRCLVLCALPQICTRQGRQAMMAYAFILLLTGPTKNTLYNTAMFSETLSCTQEQLKSASKNVTEIVLKPLRSLRNTLVDVMKTIKGVISRVKDGLIYIKDKIVALVCVIKRASEWLISSSNICNEKVNAPFVRCVASFYNVKRNCKKKVSRLLYWMCDITTLMSSTCEMVKVVDLYCSIENFIKYSIFDNVKHSLRDFVRYIKTLFYVSIGFHHSYEFQTNQSKTLRQVARQVIRDIEHRLSFFFFIFNQFTLILSTYLFYIIISTIVYWYQFCNHDWYDNRYINKPIVRLDIIRSAAGRTTVLPLTGAERALYVSVWSLRLTNYERSLLFSDIGFMFKNSVHIAIHMFLDMSVYWLLTVIQKYGRIAHRLSANSVDLVVTGSGFLSDVFRLVYNLVKPLVTDLHFDTYACLPQPIPPDYVRYQQIGTVMIIAWIMVIFEPYGFRVRNYLMTYYNEEAGRRRAVWLYNYIQQGRVSILTYVRKQLNRKVTFGVRDDTNTISRWIISRIPYAWYCFPYVDRSDRCILCGGPGTAELKCTTPECHAAYCEKCFTDVNSTCTLCRMRNQLEAEDISEESASDSDKELGNDDVPEKTHGELKSHIIILNDDGTESDQSQRSVYHSVATTPSSSDAECPSKLSSEYYTANSSVAELASFYSITWNQL